MDDQKFSGLLSHLIPDQTENPQEAGSEGSGALNNRIAELLKTAAGQAGGGAEREMNDFLNGRGELLETTRSAVVRGGKSAASVVAGFLEKKLHLSAPLAKLIAPLVVQFFPAIKQVTGTESTAKPKPRRKKKKKEESSAKPKPKPKPSNGPKKPKPSSSTKPASGQKPKKPKPSSSGKPKKPKPTASQSGRKRPKRSQEIAAGEDV